MRKGFLGLLVAALLGAVAARSVLAYSHSVNAANAPTFWAAGSKITYTFNTDFACSAGTTCGPDKDKNLVRGAVSAAFTTLMNGLPQQNGKPVITLVENNATTTVNSNACDGVNLITFTDTNPADALPDGVIAEARVFSSTDDIAGQVTFQNCGNLKFPSIKNGQIIDVDMLFNTSQRFSTNLVGNKIFDIQSVATHEGGHWLGLDHSGIVSAVMSPYGDTGTFAVRTLHSDDIASLLAIYNPGGPAISGQVKQGGATVKGAHIVATEAATGRVTASALSDAAGNYTIMGLKANTAYGVYVEPLDGPVTLDNMPDVYHDGSAAFTMQARSGNVSTGSGNTTGIDFQVSNAPNFNLLVLGVITVAGNQATWNNGSTPISIRRGAATQIAIQGADGTTALSGLPTTSSPKIGISASSLGFGNVSFTATPASDTPTGSVNLLAGGGTTAVTGGIIVTSKPGPRSNESSIGITEAANFNQTAGPFYAPGSMISIFGSDLMDASTVSASAPGAIVINGSVIGIQAVTVPIPTQLGGVSVSIGGQLAPLFFVGPTQINAMIPYELAVGTYSVSIITGPTSSTVVTDNLEVKKSAPRIFRLNQISPDLGAIINRSRSSTNIADSLVDTAHRAKAGDVLEAYGEGLGLAKSANQIAITGLVYNDRNNLAQAQETITMSLGGKPVTNISYAGLAPCCVGLFQVDFAVPAGVPSGEQPLVITTAQGSDTVKVFIQ